ncbi:1-hydroxycarotenoid 3,4-desaturase CrtD [Amorphus orientalis]|uniref:1-hydroxycarotenoid 3,4-desaturase n=1 Tax=Amorphus orientalis TaxID=649198 RepID=A0AAE3VP02_9HYPH|nr:1-hydroxycarotenoid 3,4-desaturase CrtD [Amorphus orientalis]MDQ0315485.1 1-hydroxycarotenoid 3,4-desaturase [Amorphus orientalis]
MRQRRVVIVGAGMAGLAAAIDLAARGVEVVVFDAADAPGGKMREVRIAGEPIDAGPTVLTMRSVFEELFEAAGASLADRVPMDPAETLARHAWDEGGRLDLFADRERSADAIGDFAGAAAARGYLAFCAESRRIFEALDTTFMRAQQTGPAGLTRRFGVTGAADLAAIKPFTTLWRALGKHFRDPRLRQLFGRYATYCGGSPFLAPATLMLVAHVEQSGVWMVRGGMHRLARGMADLAGESGAVVRYASPVARIAVHGRVATGVVLESGEEVAADAVISAADVSAIAGGAFGEAVSGAVEGVPPAERSQSALTWAEVAVPDGFPLARHTVFFSSDYEAEFRDVFRDRRLPEAPTVYVCAQDRDASGGPADGEPGAEKGGDRLAFIVNAPPDGDRRRFDPEEIDRCIERAKSLMGRCGLTLHAGPGERTTTTPADYERMFPNTGGALYGRAPHGAMAAFRRPGSRSRVSGLYLAGGSVHPGPGVPMAALSGRLAAEAVMQDFASTGRSRPAATPGGISTG